MPSTKETRIDRDVLPDGIYPAPYYLLGSVPAVVNLFCVASCPWVTVLSVFFFMPLFEFIAGARPNRAIPESTRRRRRKPLSELPLFRTVLLVHAALVFASLTRTIMHLHAHPSDLNLTRLISAAIVGISGLVAGHEACHKLGPNAALERTVGSLLIAYLMNPAYRGDHPHHHRHVGLSTDAVCAPMDMSPYHYAIRVEIYAWRHAVHEWRLRYARTNRLTDPFFNCLLQSILLLTANALILGANGVRAHIAIGIANTLGFNMMAMLQEHAGLSRSPDDPITAAVSWDCSNPVSNLFLFEGGRHSDHHLAGTASFAQLDLLEEAPELPYGLFTMGIIACVWPPLFWSLVRDGIREHEERMKLKQVGADRHGRD